LVLVKDFNLKILVEGKPKVPDRPPPKLREKKMKMIRGTDGKGGVVMSTNGEKS